MKTCYLTLLTVLVLTFGTSPAAATSCDVNGDGKEGLAESIHALQVMAGLSPAALPGTYTNSSNMSFKRISAGSFVMGSPAGTAGNIPSRPEETGRETSENQHLVTLTKPFYMQSTELTQRQWLEVMGPDSNPSLFTACGLDCPVEQVSWNDVQTFITTLNNSEGRLQCDVLPNTCYSLPTEAQWEYAARAGNVMAFHNGDISSPDCDPLDSNLDVIAWYTCNAATTTHPVASKQPNAWGLYDMSGNVMEWCEDWFAPFYPLEPDTDPAGPGSIDPDSPGRVARGGSYNLAAIFLRSAGRRFFDPDSASGSNGFRLVLPAGPDTNQKVFIIGDSTVHRHLTPYLQNGAGITCGVDNPENEQQGWGDGLGLYMTHPENSINKARQGASSEEFLTAPDEADLGTDRHWESTESMIVEAGGGILLIQFGSGNENRLAPAADYDDDGDIDSDDAALRAIEIETLFKQNLTFYITRARELNVLPILVTPPEGRLDAAGAPADGTHPDTRHPFPGYIHAVGLANGVEVLDLHSKSNQEFAKYSDARLLEEFGDCSYNSGYVDRVHYEPHGAEKVAGWVKELACDELNNKSLCAQFSTTSDNVIPTISLIGDYYITLALDEEFIDPGATALDDVDGNITADIVVNGIVNNDEAGEYSITYDVNDSSDNSAIQVTRIVKVISGVTIREDAEDEDTEHWIVYAGAGTITNVYDDDRQSRVIDLAGEGGTNDGFRYNIEWNETSETIVSWSMKYSEDFTFFVSAETTDGARIFVYQPTDNGMEITNGGVRFRFSLGSDTMDGTWRTYTRDLVADMKVLDPDNDELISITRIAIRGSGRVDDITSSTRGDHAVFMFNGHTYEIVKTALSWQQASDAAHAASGYLANIGSIAENHEIYSRLNRHIAEAEYNGTIASNGGGASYVWIGANDLDTEGTWLWENNDAQFWNGAVGGEVVDGLYNNWGRDTVQAQHEPDNASNQDAAAMALTEWPIGSGNLGQTSQWNDLITDDLLYYIIEYGN